MPPWGRCVPPVPVREYAAPHALDTRNDRRARPGLWGQPVHPCHPIHTARTGLYSQFEVQRGLGVAQMLRHFEETPGGWQIRDHVRHITRFQQHNVLGEPPAKARFDLVLCRNVLLYFTAEVREAAFARLASAMTHDGFLMLGAGETVIGQTRAFVPSDGRLSIYERHEDARASLPLAAN